MAFTKITAAGIGTTETVTVDGLTVINDGSFGGNLTVAGVLTYEDVTNVDSVGLITARNGIVVGSGITLSKDGDIFATGITTVSGNVKVGTGITLSPDGDGFYTGVVTATTFKGDGSQLTGVNSDVVDDTTPQLGGNLDVNTKNILFGDSSDGSSDDVLKFGAGSDLSLYHTGTNSYIKNTTNILYLASDQINILNAAANSAMAKFYNGAQAELYYNNTKRLETQSAGVEITGKLTFANDGLANGSIDLGADADLNLYHDNSDAYFDNNTGDFYIRNDGNSTSEKVRIQAKGGEQSIICSPNGAVELYFDNSKKLETVTGGVYVYGDLLFGVGTTGHLYGGDNDKVILGSGSDFQLFHNGSNSFISNTTGIIQIDSDDRVQVNATEFRVKNAADTETIAKFIQDGAVELYHNNNKRLEVLDNGITISGGGLNLQRSADAHAAAIYFAGFGDTNHMMWHDYQDNPNGTRGTGSGYDGIKWNVYAGLRLFHGNEAETIAEFNGNGTCELYFNNVQQLKTHPNGIFTRGIYPMSDNSFNIGSGSERFNTIYATNGSIQTSDRNQKNTIIESDLGLDFVNKLKPVSYKWNEDDGKIHYGLIAQEVEETLLDIDKTVSDFGAVSKEDDSPMGLSYNEFISPLVKAIQELTAKNDALEARIKTLEG